MPSSSSPTPLAGDLSGRAFDMVASIGASLASPDTNTNKTSKVSSVIQISARCSASQPASTRSNNANVSHQLASERARDRNFSLLSLSMNLSFKIDDESRVCGSAVVVAVASSRDSNNIVYCATSGPSQQPNKYTGICSYEPTVVVVVLAHD